VVRGNGPQKRGAVLEIGQKTTQGPEAAYLRLTAAAMDYLLDTNACIALNKGEPVSVRARFAKAVHAGARVWVSAVVLYELWYGVAKSARPEENAEDLTTFLTGPVQVLGFEEEDARAAGHVRASLERIGKPIGAYDLLIAGQALHHKLTLVTANTKEFARIKGLLWEDWGKVAPSG
jgi:tRNA(fMet)-specific endonuclease VapC